jgi:DNA replication protein DnaC
VDHRELSSNPCKLCGDSEYILRNGNLYPCECLRKKKQDEYADSIIPSRYRGVSLDSLKPSWSIALPVDRQAKAIEMIKANPLDGYIFLGPTGVGKTHLMYALVDYAIHAGRHVIATTCSQFVKSARESEFDKTIEPIISQETLDQYAHGNTPISKSLHVFIDEMDKVKLTDYSQLLLFDFANFAYDNYETVKFTLTSNLPPKKFEEVFGAAFYRKLSTMSKFIVYGGQ